MCGIAGFSLKRGMAKQSDLIPLANALAHRGPNGEGFFTFLHMGLTHRRLSIIDLTGGHQPLEIKTPKAPIAAVVNGEIYNYKTLQKTLTTQGIHLNTQSDSEPLLHTLMHKGMEGWKDLQGMYAAAVVDGRTTDLYLGIDPFGIKPLYYAETDKGFVFASEPRAITAAGWVKPELNEKPLGALLNEHYTRGAETLFKHIHRMLPGERFRVREGRIVERTRQFPNLPPALQTKLSLPEALDQFETHFKAAVERHLQADVPYGVLLSGGLDSSSITLMMHKLGVPITAYTAKFKTAGDEDTAAAALAQSIGATHTTITYGEKDFWQGLNQLAFAMDDLTTDYSSLPLLSLMKRARNDVTILLSGEGGDEMLAGYRGYRANPLQTWLKSFRKGDATPHLSLFHKNPHLTCPPKPTPAWNTHTYTRLQHHQAADVAEWLPHDLLNRLDRVSMHHGIEGRVPFLDDTFSSWAFSLPDNLKVGPHPQTGKPQGKYILRQWLAKQGYSDLAFGKKKGFSVPVGTYLTHNTLNLQTLFNQSPILQSLLKKGAINKLLSNLHHPKTANLCFSLTLLALWHRTHIEGLSLSE